MKIESWWSPVWIVASQLVQLKGGKIINESNRLKPTSTAEPDIPETFDFAQVKTSRLSGSLQAKVNLK
jgi:hypothetical protein